MTATVPDMSHGRIAGYPLSVTNVVKPPLPDIDSLWEHDEPGQTEDALRSVLPAAIESGDFDYRAELLTRIARAQGLQGRFGDAEESLGRAEALLDHCGPGPRIRAILERGRVLNSSGRREQSRPMFLEAFKLAMRSREEFLAIDAAHMLGIVEVPEKQLAWNNRALDMARVATDERARGWQGSLHNNLGWAYHDQRRYHDALRHFEAGLSFQRGMNREREARIASWTVGRCLRSMGRFEEALANQRANSASAAAAGDGDGFVEEELGECLLALGRGEEARNHFASAFQQLSNDRWLVQNEPDRMTRLERLASA